MLLLLAIATAGLAVTSDTFSRSRSSSDSVYGYRNPKPHRPPRSGFAELIEYTDTTNDEDDLFRLILARIGPDVAIDHVEFKDGAFVAYWGGCVLSPLPQEIPRTWHNRPVKAGACGIAPCKAHRHSLHRATYVRTRHNPMHPPRPSE